MAKNRVVPAAPLRTLADIRVLQNETFLADRDDRFGRSTRTHTCYAVTGGILYNYYSKGGYLTKSANAATWVSSEHVKQHLGIRESSKKGYNTSAMLKKLTMKAKRLYHHRHGKRPRFDTLIQDIIYELTHQRPVVVTAKMSGGSKHAQLIVGIQGTPLSERDADKVAGYKWTVVLRDELQRDNDPMTGHRTRRETIVKRGKSWFLQSPGSGDDRITALYATSMPNREVRIKRPRRTQRIAPAP